jgi:hypothetical protein
MKNLTALLLVAAMPLAAGSIEYTIDVPGVPSSLLSSATFTYDGSRFTDFIVVWRGDTFDLTASANAPTFVNAPASCYSGYSGPQLGFALMTQALPSCNGIPITYQFIADVGAGAPPPHPQDVFFEGQYPINGNQWSSRCFH